MSLRFLIWVERERSKQPSQREERREKVGEE
uniref:Uncharacterized protein n=1 Tax=Arundo donax TaxID=35708 RepID=A0A0A9EIZ9_ARUDO